ncbi:DUF1120 domain-containing protein [Enterobacter kobei]|nr:DUF1120 domain-containing protein [Enterobacter kobei]
MKNTLRHALAGAIIVSGAAGAAETADVTINGRLLPPTCSISLSSPTVAYGTLRVSALNTDTPSHITPYLNGTDPTTTLNVSCEGPALIGAKIADQRAGTVAATDEGIDGVLGVTPTQLFGLGSFGGKSLGAYAILSSNVLVGGAAGKVISSTDNGGNWADQSADFGLSNTAGWLWSWTSDTSGAAAEPVQTVAQTFTIKSAVQPMNELSITDSAPLDGLVTIELVYL